MESQFFPIVFNVPLHALYTFSDGTIVHVQFNLFLFILIEFFLKVMMSVHIICDFFFKCDYVRFILDDFFLCIFHYFVTIYLFIDLFYMHFDWYTILFHELETVMDEFVFSLLESSDVGLDVAVIEVCVACQHCLAFMSTIYLQTTFNNKVKTLTQIEMHRFKLIGLDFYWVIIIMKNRIRNFDIQTKLGSGSYGVIYKALNKSTREICVLKQISLSRLTEKARKNAINEATIMGKLIHPFIVRYQQSFIEDNTLNIVMEYCDNGDLANFLKSQIKKPLKQQKIWRIFIEICVGLEYIHKNKILHRDIKTLNIFMNKNEEIKIGDLGVAKMLTSNQFAQTMVGTPFYLSPELCQQKPYNEKSDIWALGCLLYELCTYRHPFEAQNQASLILKIIRGKYVPIPEFYSKDLKEIIDLCLERDYKRRPTTSNLLAKQKIQQLVQQFGIDKLVDEYMKKVIKQKQNLVAPQPEEIRPPVKPKQPEVKPSNEGKIEGKRQESAKREEVKKQQNMPKPVLAIPIQKRAQTSNINQFQNKKQVDEMLVKKQNKLEFKANLEKMIDEGQKNRKVIKQGPIYTEIPVKNGQIIEKVVKKQDKIQKISEKVQQLRAKPKPNQLKSPAISEQKKPTPMISQKKSPPSVESLHFAVKKPDPSHLSEGKLVNLSKPPLMPSKPPMPPPQNKEQILKVKVQKVVQPKVYDSQKVINKPVGIIKSGGFSPNLQQKQKPVVITDQRLSQQKNPMLCKKSSINRQQKIDKDEVKQLFGPSPTIQHKSQRNFKSVSTSAIEQKKDVKKQQAVKISRVRKGSKNELSRNARNASRYNEISKEEEDMVMNLPTTLKRTGAASSDSDDEHPTKQSYAANHLRNKTKDIFQLKDINDQFVLQKYEDFMQSGTNTNAVQEQSSQVKIQNAQIKEEEPQTYLQTQTQVKDQIQIEGLVEVDVEAGDQIIEDLSGGRKDSNQSNQCIEQILQGDKSEYYEQNRYNVKDEVLEDYRSQHEEGQEWSFDGQPQLPMLQEKQNGQFEENNLYQPDEQIETAEQKISHLKTMLSDNMKRQNQINKLMQLKITECHRFIPVEESFQQIMSFFRKKLNDEITDEDDKEVEIFLKKKGIADFQKFQNIYKIIHFEYELSNTRLIIQRICKKLSEYESSP